MSLESPSAGNNVLVVYYSVSGNTARVARDLAKRTHADIENLRDAAYGGGCIGYLKAAYDAVRGKPARLGPLSHDPRSYELVVVGTPVWAWKITPAVRAYLMRYARDFRKLAFFVTSGDTDVAKVLPSMEAALNGTAAASAGFNSTELADPAAYEAKLAGFIRAMNRPSGTPQIGPVSTVPAR